MPSENLDGGGKCSTLASKTGCNAHEKKGRVIMKRLIGILLVVLAVFCFVACDSDNPSPSGSSSMPDENVMTQYSNVMSDAQFLIDLRSNPDRTEQEEVIASKFDMPLEEDTIRLKEGETVTGLSHNVYSAVLIKYNNNVFEVDAEYNDGTSNHSIYIKNTRTSEGVVQISIELDGVSYYFENSMGPDGYPSN